ncbi:unnamed protein product [Rangifer tarandus platyrhynchus]|uniref:Uncharacterized protein n=2 Tax=Rangifer tarandus platyrhynchus TaxID=3082113 RepID=A0ABN8YHE9_RANTA|nr:unnamed protein product [Rangifer tarandus platyrhynchus]
MCLVCDCPAWDWGPGPAWSLSAEMCGLQLRPPGVAVVLSGLAHRSSSAVTSSRIHQASEGKHCPGRVAQGMQGARGGPAGQARHPKSPEVSGGKGPGVPTPRCRPGPRAPRWRGCDPCSLARP